MTSRLFVKTVKEISGWEQMEAASICTSVNKIFLDRGDIMQRTIQLLDQMKYCTLWKTATSCYGLLPGAAGSIHLTGTQGSLHDIKMIRMITTLSAQITSRKQ